MVGSADSETLFLGRPLSSWVGKTFPDLLATSDVDAVVSLLRVVLEERVNAAIRADLEVDGTRLAFDLAVTSIPEPTADGARIEMVCRAVESAGEALERSRREVAAANRLVDLAIRMANWPDDDVASAVQIVIASIGVDFGCTDISLVERSGQRHGAAIPFARWRRPDQPELSATPSSDWIEHEMQHGRWVEGLPLAELSEASGDLADQLARAGVADYLSMPCQRPGRDCDVYLELRWVDSPGALGPEDSRRLIRVGEILAGLVERNRARRERDDVSRRIELLSDLRAEGYCEVGADGVVHFASPSLDRLLGRPVAGLVGESLSALVHPLDREMVEASAEGVLAGRKVDRLVFRACVRGGGYRWLESIGAVSRAANGEILIASIVRDVSRREIERATLVRRIELETLVAGLTRKLLAADTNRIESIVDASLGTIAEAMHALRVRLVCFGPAGSEGIESFVYQRSDAPVDGIEMTHEHLARFPWSRRQLAEQEILDVPDVGKLPPEAQADRAVFEVSGIASVLSVPAFARGKIAGILSVYGDTVVDAFPDYEKRLLRVLGELFVGALGRKRAEKKLRSSEERFRTLAENMRDSICEIAESGEILFASPSYAELLGGTTVGLIGTDPLDSVHAEDRQRVSTLFRPGGRSRRKGTLLYRALSMHGHTLHLEATAREFLGRDGRPRVVVVTRDVTERESARGALERQLALEARVAELSRHFVDVEIDAIDDGIQSRLGVVAELADAQHSWLYSFTTRKDRFEMFDWWRGGDDQSGRLVPPDRSSQTFPYSTGLIISGQVYHVSDSDSLPDEAEAERLDMRARGIRSILAIPIMSGGRFVGCLGFESFEREIGWSEQTIVLLRMVGEIFYSTLRRRRADQDLRDSQSQLLQSQKMEAVGTLAGGIAHDFNNHLAVMLGNARYVRQEVDAPADILEAIDDFERSADHCAQLTRSLLAFSRRAPAEVIPTAVDELVCSVEGLVRPLLPRSIEFSVWLAPDLGRFAVDRVQIQQLLVNLLVNARDAMPEGGPLQLRAVRRRLEVGEVGVEDLYRDREYVVMCVEDAGCGMDEETRSRVFEPFYTTKGLGKGTGLGLATAYGIVQQSEGAISVESELGEGAVFRVYLPACSD